VLRCVFRFFAVCHLGRPDFRLSPFVCCSVVAVCCSVLQCACCGELLYATLEDEKLAIATHKYACCWLQCCCSVLQCACYCVLQCITAQDMTLACHAKVHPYMCDMSHIYRSCSSRTTKVHLVGMAVLLQYVAVCVLQCVAVQFNMCGMTCASDTTQLTSSDLPEFFTCV